MSLSALTPIPARGTARYPAGARIINRNSPTFPATTITDAWPASSDGWMVESRTASGGRVICHSDHLIVVPRNWQDAPAPLSTASTRLWAAVQHPTWEQQQAATAEDATVEASTRALRHARLYFAWVLQHLLPLGWDEFRSYRVSAMAAITAADQRLGEARATAVAVPAVGRE